jgi:3'-5' exoribonuclease 1
LELTCWNKAPLPGLHNEIIEIGIVEMDLSTLAITCEAQYFVRPSGRWEISGYCTKITGITKSDIIRADSLEEVLKGLEPRFQPDGKRTAAWGNDVAVLKNACASANLESPFRRSLDLSQLFRELFLLPDRLSLEAALQHLGMTFEGIKHGALPDARNEARLHSAVLRGIRQSQRQIVSSDRKGHQSLN